MPKGKISDGQNLEMEIKHKPTYLSVIVLHKDVKISTN